MSFENQVELTKIMIGRIDTLYFNTFKAVFLPQEFSTDLHNSSKVIDRDYVSDQCPLDRPVAILTFGLH